MDLSVKVKKHLNQSCNKIETRVVKLDAKCMNLFSKL